MLEFNYPRILGKFRIRQVLPCYVRAWREMLYRSSNLWSYQPVLARHLSREQLRSYIRKLKATKSVLCLIVALAMKDTELEAELCTKMR